MSFIKEQLANNKKIVILVCLVIIIVAVTAGFSYVKNKRSHTYYAVFTVNNQVYFGSLSDRDDKYLNLKNVVYLQAPDPSKPEQVQLIKRGTELHNPTGDMMINRSQILYVEELKADSQVSKTIETYRSTSAK